MAAQLFAGNLIIVAPILLAAAVCFYYLSRYSAPPFTYALICAVVIVAALLLLSVGSLYLTKWSMKPIAELAAAAEAIPLPNPKQRLTVEYRDSPLGRLARAVNNMLEHLDAAFEEQQRFTSRAAHELRTPLTILKGEAQVALMRTRSAEEYVEIIKSSLEEIDKLVVMIDDLLLLARYEAGEIENPFLPVSLDEIVSGVVADLDSLACAGEIDLEFAAEEGLSVMGDPKALERLVFNLVENAVRYTPPGGRVTVKVTRMEGQVKLIITDMGIGIPDQDVPYLYNRFFRSAAARKMHPGGSGLGLPFSAAITRLHNATIDVTSKVGEGSCFIVSFSVCAQ